MKKENVGSTKIYNCIESLCDSGLVSLLFLDFLNSKIEASNNLEIQRHPLGFIAMKWPVSEFKVLRLHIWDSSFGWSQAENLQIHDHAFSFKSVVLIGIIKNTIYSTENSFRNYSVLRTSYANGQSILSPMSEKIGLSVESEEIYRAGNYYQMRNDVFHKTSLESSFGVTALAAKYETHAKDGARVISQNESRVSFRREVVEPSEIRKMISIANLYLQKSLAFRGDQLPR